MDGTPAKESDTLPGRRTLLRAAAIGLGAVAISSLDSLQRSPANALTAPPSVYLPPGIDAATLHLLRRVTFGLSPELYADVKAVASIDWLTKQLSPSSIDDSTCDAILTHFPLANATPPTAWAHGGGKPSFDPMLDLARATIARSIWSQRQLFEVMVEFWSNHFNVTSPSGNVWSGRAWEDAYVIRPNALGRFEDLLRASSRSPSMGLYLDNFSSTGSNPNENYARELLELHTVGVDAGYTHADIRGAALALTGHWLWTPYNGGDSGNYGTWRYQPTRHYVGAVQCFGWSHANASATNGLAVSDSLISYLAHHPSTARHLAQKLATRFVSDTPSTTLINSLARVYLDNDTQIVPVLKSLFASSEFLDSVGGKFRRPYEDLVATLRICGITADPNADSLSGIDAIAKGSLLLGQAPLLWGTPDGYPDVAANWVGSGTSLFRWNVHAVITQHWAMTGLKYPDLYKRLVPNGATTRGALVDATIASLLPGIAVSATHRSALLTFLGGDGPVNAHTGDTTWLYPILAALVLDTPYWSQR